MLRNASSAWTDFNWLIDTHQPCLCSDLSTQNPGAISSLDGDGWNLWHRYAPVTLGWSMMVTTCHDMSPRNHWLQHVSLLHGPVEAVHQFRSFESWSHRLWTQHILMSSQIFTTPYIRLCMALQDVWWTWQLIEDIWGLLPQDKPCRFLQNDLTLTPQPLGPGCFGSGCLAKRQYSSHRETLNHPVTIR
jgi:hypothetical protein